MLTCATRLVCLQLYNVVQDTMAAATDDAHDSFHVHHTAFGDCECIPHPDHKGAPNFIVTRNCAVPETAGIVPRLRPYTTDGRMVIACIPPAPHNSYKFDMKPDPGVEHLDIREFKCRAVYGLHSCAHYALFKPTLYEVAQLIAADPELRAAPGLLYVRTVTCNPAGDLTDSTDCIAPDKRSHYAVTVVFYHRRW